MSKPAWCPPDVWTAATNAIAQQKSDESLSEAVARALLVERQNAAERLLDALKPFADVGALIDDHSSQVVFGVNHIVVRRCDLRRASTARNAGALTIDAAVARATHGGGAGEGRDPPDGGKKNAAPSA